MVQLPANFVESPFLPVLVFLAEAVVVTLGTLRTIFVAQGKKYLAPFLGVFEIAIWLFAIGQVMLNLSRTDCFLAFAGGFTLGNYLGILIEQKLALGDLVVRIITNRSAAALVDGLRSAHYGVTTLDGHGATGPVQVILTMIKRKELPNVIAIVERTEPLAFYSVDELQVASRGVFPQMRSLRPEARGWRAVRSASAASRRSA